MRAVNFQHSDRFQRDYPKTYDWNGGNGADTYSMYGHGGHVSFGRNTDGQDTKVITLTPEGKVAKFEMNDRCAAGTGRFLEVMAAALSYSMPEFIAAASAAPNARKLNSMCTVFAESEVISLIARGEPRENIIAGIHDAIAARVVAMARRVGIVEPLMMTGGVAHNIGVVKALEAKLGYPVQVSAYAQVNGAIGAACLAAASF